MEGWREWVPAAMLRARSRDSGLAWYSSCVGGFKLKGCQHGWHSSC